jgi:hypothetical protein
MAKLEAIKSKESLDKDMQNLKNLQNKIAKDKEELEMAKKKLAEE